MVADAGDHRHAQQRNGAAERLVAESEEVGERAAAAGDDDRFDLFDSSKVGQSLRNRSRCLAVLHRREAPNQRACPAATLKPGENVITRFAGFACDHADRPWQLRPRQQLLWLEQPFALELAPQRGKLREQVAFSGDSQVADVERERR